MKVRLSKAQKKRLLDAPRIKAIRLLKAIEKQIEQSLFEQIWDIAKRKMRGTKSKGKRVVIPASLVNSYEKVLTDMMKQFLKNGRYIGKLRSRAYRKKIGKRFDRLRKKIKELETPEEAVVRSQAYRTRVYVSWVNKKVKKWVDVTAKKRFRRTISRARGVMMQGVKESWTRAQMRKAMAQQFRHYKQYELDRVITTEATRAVNLGTYHQEQDDKMIIGWRVVVNYTGCPICNAAEDEGFIAREDIDGSYIPPLHPNCECTLEPVFYTEQPAVQYLKSHPEKDPFRQAA